MASASDKVKSKPRRKKRKAQTPYTHKPQNMSLEEWQIALRKEFGRQQKFKLQNVGDEAVFSEFQVTNPQSKRTYRVSIRGPRPGDNHCTCPDFAVNTLGTCKHIEFALGRLERQSGVKKVLAAGYQPPFAEVYLRYGAKREVGVRPGADCPAELVKLIGHYFDERLILKDESYGKFDQFMKKAHQIGHDMRINEDALRFIAEVRDKAALAGRVDAAFPDGPNSSAFDDLLKIPLYPYQRQGALFMARAGRSLLADDMGLGKTIQAMAATEILARLGGVERVLVVTPTSLKHQWKDEIRRFTQRSVEVIEGLSQAREKLYQTPTFYKIINYDVIHADIDLISRWAPDLIILDEAQRIKNWKTRASKSVKQLPSQHAIVLTGTPLENRLQELHSIVEFVDRFRLGPAFRFLAEHQHVDDGGRVIGYHNLSSISQTLAPILVRRTKAQVLSELPERIDEHVVLAMTPEQQKIHAENQEIVARIVARWRKHHFLTEADQRRLTISLQNMRMCCNSTYLVDQETDFGVKSDEAVSMISDLVERPQTKIVVFSQWLRTHELLMRRIDTQPRKKRPGYVLFHGGIPGSARKDLVKQFREDPACRLFLSTDAGGVGLNLQHASVVFNMDLPWNPAVLEQRIGRVHRLGQHQPVHVLNFVSENSIEQGMLGLLKFKKSLFAGILDSGQDEVFLGGTSLDRFMKSVESATGAIGEAPVEAARPEPEAPIQLETPAPAETPAVPATEAPALPATEAPALPATEAPPGAPAVDGRQIWSELINVGRQFLEGLSQSLGLGQAATTATTAATQPGGAPAQQPMIERDPTTGQQFLKLPLPAPQMLEKLAGLLGSMVAAKPK